MAPSQPPPDKVQDSLKLVARSVSRLDDDAEDRTVRPRPFSPKPSRFASHSREPSLEKQLPATLTSPRVRQITGGASSAPASSSPTSSPASAPTSASSSGIIERPIDPTKAALYGHHRQTSIVHGYQHSRNGSVASSAGPVSPQMIAAAAGADVQSVAARLESDGSTQPRAPTSLAESLASASSLSMERSASATDASPGPAAGLRKLERGHSKSHSSRHHREDQKTVGECAFHVLLTSFVGQAEEKLAESLVEPLDVEPQIERICGPGVDQAFDQLIIALGHIARPKPKPLIDTVMLWRKHKSEAVTEARTQLQQLRGNQSIGSLVRRNTEPVQSGPENASPTGATVSTLQKLVSQQERRSTVATYILCRVLLEVFSKTTMSCIGSDMEDKLEGIMFTQLKITEWEQLVSSPLKLANWSLFAQLLGHMSAINFNVVTGRFLEELEKSVQDRALVRSPTSSASGRDPETKQYLVLGGMQHLRIKLQPDAAWEDSCEFLIALGRLFNRCRGLRIKMAFCQILQLLVLPIAAQASSNHLTHPKWAEVMSTISQRLGQIFMKPRYWTVAFPLTATMLCLSSPDTFASQWSQLTLSLQTKFRDRPTRPLCLQVISRLLWTYLFRATDSLQSSAKKLDDLVKLVMPPPAKRNAISFDPAVTEPMIQIIRIIGFRYPEYCFRSVIFPLINADLFVANKELKVEQLEPDRIVVGIRAFLCIMSDLEKGDKGQPPFPQFYHGDPLTDKLPLYPILSLARNSQTSNSDASLTEARPVLTQQLSEGVREYYSQFCQILGKITIICDNTFGGQAALDERFNSPGPKTPIADTFNFARRDEHQIAADQKQAFYELLHVAVKALPRCLSVDIPINPLINLLCTGTAHVQNNIAQSSATSLKAIARHSHAQQVTMGFARFIFNFDDRYSTMSDGGMLGPDHIENTLRLYVELLQIWIDEIKQKSRDAASSPAEASASDKRALKLDLSSIWAEVDQAEAHGLFFLCSQSRRVRHYAVTALRLITEFDKALGKGTTEEKESPRLINILENYSSQVMDFNDEHLTVAERSRLQRAFDKCPFTVAICRDLVGNRILEMYTAIVHLSEPNRGFYYLADQSNGRAPVRSPAAQPEVLIEQWKLYLIFACTTLADAGTQTPNPAKETQHARKTSKQPMDKIVTARTLFKYLLPLLSCSSASVRDAVVVAMGSINKHIYRPLVEELYGHVCRVHDDSRARIHSRSNSIPRRNRTIALMRTEATHVFKLTAHFLKEPPLPHVEYILDTLSAYTKDLKLLLMDGEVQMDWEFQQLRRHYCGLIEIMFEGVSMTDNPLRWMTFEARKSAFSLMEDWCGFSPNQTQIKVREHTMRQSLLDRQASVEPKIVSAAMERERHNLKTAALNSMATLCAGPLMVVTESGITLQFDMRRMLVWIEAIFNSGNDKMKMTGRRALKNLLVHNREIPYLVENCISRCYLSQVPKVLESYFTVTIEVLQEHGDYPCPFWRTLGLCLFILGNDQSTIRTKSSTMLRTLDTRQQRNSKIQDFDISISDKTQAVYKLAQFEISKRLAKQHADLAFYIFSDFAYYFKDLVPAAQRNVIAVILPWIQAVELKLDPNGGPTAESYVLLANLLDLTIKSGGALHNEVQALWQALATGPYPGNVRLVLDFIMQLCLERREQNFVEYAKQIVVFLSTTNSTPGIKVVEFLLMQITPKAMVPHEIREAVPPPPEINSLPYCADLSSMLPVGPKPAGFSLGQLSLILLVDLMVSPVQLKAESVPLILQVVTVLWDHYTPLVQDQAQEMLVHLVHELVISRLDDEQQGNVKQSFQELVDLTRRHDRSVVWDYEDSNGNLDDQANKVPPGMEVLTTRIVETFETTFAGIKEQWGRLSLTWATSCPVRHLARRSFQIFRCVLTSLDQRMLGDMLARLSNAVADEDAEIRSFSMEILTTLKTLIVKLDADDLIKFPQLFWTTCACLDSINEREFLEAVEMLNELVQKFDLRSGNVRRLLADEQPEGWDGPFEGIQPLLYKGLRSALCWQPTLDALGQLVKLPTDALIGDDSRLFFTLLANFPRFLNEMERGTVSQEAIETALLLQEETDKQGLESLWLVLDGLISGQQRDGGEFLKQLFAALKEHYLPRLEFKMITFLIGLLTNSLSWVKVQTMRILCVAIPEVDMRKPELAGHGSDLISPLLRLLQTEFCMDALEVLDNIMTMSGSHTDRHHVRMSMTRFTSRAVRKEYERTQSLFGIPEASGWAIPVPARKAEATRCNVRAAFRMCQSAEGSFAETTPTSEVEFHADDYPYGYFETDRADTMLSDDGRMDALGGDVVTKLDSLDDFFDEQSSPMTDDDDGSSRTITEFTPEAFESSTELYDHQILPILNEASSGTTLFQNGFMERPIMGARDVAANTMNPGAFTAVMPPRPGLHSRSVTSPSAPASYQALIAAGEIPSDDDYLSGGLSEGDEERSSARYSEKPFILESVIQSPRQGASGGARRLLSKSRDEAVAPVTPRMPTKMF
ncbi:hypothetical protein CDD81_1195 [Ophiocordyceps australis]|uniref:Uncharacterized protein n=1 Tax=Ophiocordyceps australis TaxID=1399860 RepID=A0A2C5YDQ9_9HYPO|nr:hypothetical protein CDD81_1195 [Ophiocordyceps australis]